MNPPYSLQQFLGMFEQYNLAIWPMQVVLNLLALGAVGLAIWKRPYTNRTIGLVLSFLWAWTGIAFHLLFFTSINGMAYVFGTLCIVQALLFFYYGVLRGAVLFAGSSGAFRIVGGLFMLYGLLLYPLLGIPLGHTFPQNPTFGAPCPTTIFTLGLLLWTSSLPAVLLILPLLWSLLGASAAVSFGIYEDIGLLIAGVIAVPLLWLRERKRKTAPEKVSTIA